MKYNYILITLLAILCFSFQQIELSKGAQKKYDKVLIEVWKTEVMLKEVDLSNVSENTGLKGYERVQSIAEANGNLLGYAMISKARGRYDDFDLVVIYDLNLNIKGSEILAYREDWGGEITSVRWLKQFIGLNAESKMTLTHDIQGISGATISCQSATVEFKRLTLTLNHMKKEGII